MTAPATKHVIVRAMAVAVLLLAAVSAQAQSLGQCKKPTLEQRLLSDDVRFASPFYVIALPRSANTEQIDNICYTYYENEKDKGKFFHIMSITYNNGSNAYHMYSKGDVENRMGLAEATALADSECVFDDYTLKPICNVTVFVLYRCFIRGNCDAIDVGIMPGTDVRVVLAANPKVSSECRRETEANLKDTSVLDGGDYVILPQRLKPQCITKYGDMYSIGQDRAVGSKEVQEVDSSNRFGDEQTRTGNPMLSSTPIQPQTNYQQSQGMWTKSPTQGGWTNQQTQGTWPNQHPHNPWHKQQTQGTWPQNVPNSNLPPTQSTPNRMSFNPYGTTVKGYTNAQAGASTTGAQGYTPAANTWQPGPAPWDGQTMLPGMQNHYHIWQTHSPAKLDVGKNPNVYYHIHSWESLPPGCRCN